MNLFKDSILKLIIDTSTNLPPDVRNAVKNSIKREKENSIAAIALNTIAQNIDYAYEDEGAICQDTGMPTFYIHTPVGFNQIELKKNILDAIVDATKLGKLRPNSVDSLTGKNSGNNLGGETPVIHFEQWENNFVEIKLILKGGGCENKNIQYSLPTELEHIGKAGRNIDGVRKCILHSVWQAQGQGCSIGSIGVAIGGDRTTGFEFSKKQLFRKLDDTNPNPELQKLEEYILENANKLEIGTMGFGGNSTLIGCKIGAFNRLPASFFVSVSYNCWAFRRQGINIDASNGAILNWIYKDDLPIEKMASEQGLKLSGNEIHLTTPISEEEINKLKIGDLVLITGKMFTARDAIHAHLMKHDSPINLNGEIIYHCGPVVLKDGDDWKIMAAGPTTSSREEPYQDEIIRKNNIRAVIGKGGMGNKTLAALKNYGAVYLNAIGGAAQYYSRCIEKVTGVDFLEFGTPEAMWHLQVKNFPAIVTMDSHGNSLHKIVENNSGTKLETFKI